MMKLILLFGGLLPLASLNTVWCQSQESMNQEASDAFKKADAELNAVYVQILKRFESDSVVVNSLKEAQRAWLIFRDAHMSSIYPDSDHRWYGTVMAMCHSLELTVLTKARTQQLQQWSEGIQYGNVCAGSRPFKKD